jgi:hypothetical protein
MSNTDIVIAKPVTKVVTLKVAETEIERVKAKYLALKINGLTDKKGIKVVSAARKEIRRTRIDFTNYSDTVKGRVNKWKAKLIADTTRVVDEFLIIENHLIAEEEKIEKEREALRIKKEKEAAAKLQARIDQLTPYNWPINMDFIKSLNDVQFIGLVQEAKKKFENDELQRNQLAEQLAEAKGKVTELQQQLAEPRLQVEESGALSQVTLPQVADTPIESTVYVATEVEEIAPTQPVDIPVHEDRAKLLTLATALNGIQLPECTDQQSIDLVEAIKQSISDFSARATILADALLTPETATA